MSCLGNNYNPNPPNVWSRVVNNCVETNDLTQQIKKGNILQYKNNSSCLTKKQRYSQIVNGHWTSRRKSWATQTENYTNPNTSHLLQVNYQTFELPENIANPDCPNINTYKEGGNLVCGQIIDPCTDTIIKSSPVNPISCNPTTNSNVPGKKMLLCWDNRLDTWYPRNRYIMNNSGNKWPQGYKFT